MAFTFTLNGKTYTSDPAVDVPNGYRFNGYGYITALANLVQDIVTVMTNQVGLATTQAGNAAASAASAANSPGTNATSATSLTIGMGNQVFTMTTGKAFSNQQVILASSASPTNWMAGTLTAYNPATGGATVNVTNYQGGGTFVSWTVALSGAPAISGVLNEMKGASIASADTINLDAASGNLVHITGTTQITTITLAAGARRTLVFDAAVPLVNGANLVLPGGKNITTTAGDMLMVAGDGGGKVLGNDYIKANGQAVSSPGVLPIGALAAFDSDVTANVVVTSTGDSYLKTGVITDSAAYPNAPAGPWCSNAQPAIPTTAGAFTSAAFGNGVFLQGIGSGRIQRSTDGLNYAASVPLTGFTGAVIVTYGNGCFLALDTVTAACAKSVDGGLTWTYGTLPSAGNWCAPAFGNGIWVTAKIGSTAAATSTDGLVWLPRTNSRTFNGYQTLGTPLVFGGGVFVLVDIGYGSAQCSTTVDGITWNNRAIRAPTTSVNNLCYGAGLFVLGVNDSAYAVYTSPDGQTWTPQAIAGVLSTTVNPLYLNGQFFIGFSGNCFTSANGTAWTLQSVFSSPCVYTFYTGSIYIGMAPNMQFYRSTNGMQYLSTVSFAPYTINQMSFGGGWWLMAATQSGGQLHVSLDGGNWFATTAPMDGATQYGVAFFAGLFCLVGQSTYATSPDLYSWTPRTVPTYKGSNLLVANGRMYSFANGATFSYTIDGLTWNNTGVLPGNYPIRQLAYSAGAYVACDSINNILTSSDGLTFVLQSATGLTGTVYGVCAAGGFFFCLTSTGLWQSTIGASWVRMICAFGTDFSGTAWLHSDGTNVAVVNANGAIHLWNTSGANYYRRVLATPIPSLSGNVGPVYSQGAFNNAGVLVWRALSGLTSSVLSFSPTKKVLNDTNLKTYNAVATEQTNFYKRVA